MNYTIRVQTPHCIDLVITDVEERKVGELVTRYCSEHSVCIVTPMEREEENHGY